MGIGVSLRGEECESSGHDQVLLLFRISDSDIQTTFPGSTSATWVISVLKAIMLPLHEELWRVFSPKQQTFWPGSLLYWGNDENKCYNNTEGYEVHCHVTTASILKFTPVPWIFFLLGKIFCRAGSKETFLKVGTLSFKARAYPRQIKTNKMNFKNAAILPL